MDCLEKSLIFESIPDVTKFLAQSPQVMDLVAKFQFDSTVETLANVSTSFLVIGLLCENEKMIYTPFIRNKYFFTHFLK